MSKSYQLIFFMALFSFFSSYSMQPVKENSDSWEKIVDYHFEIGRKSHSEAKATCQSIGAKLFEPRSEKVYNEVSALAKAKGISKFWLGIHDKSNEGKFVYESDGKAICWTNWHKGEPNDWGKGEDCVRSGHGHGGVNKWNDSPCTDKYSIICEKSGPLEYHFGIGKKNHLEAKATCQSIGGKLFEPKSEKVYNEVSTLAKIKGISTFWMGMHDISNEGQFTYDSDGKDVVWTNWHGGEPNDWGKGEDCVRSVRRGNKWNDSPCNDKYSFICEKSACELIDEHDYHFDFEIKSYSEAKTTCQNIGGKLFEPKSEKVYDCVSALAKTKGISIFWLGIHDISNEGKFTYESDGKAVDWTNWHKGEPNDWGKGEDCVRSGHGHGGVNKWNDSPCNDKYSIICEKSDTESTTPAASTLAIWG